MGSIRRAIKNPFFGLRAEAFIAAGGGMEIIMGSWGKIDFRRLAAILICIFLGSLFIWALFSYALPIVLPFCIGIALGGIAKRLASHFSKKDGFFRRALGAIIYILLLALLLFGAFFAISRGLSELLRFAEGITSDGGATFESTLEEIRDYLSNLTSRLPIISDIRDKTENSALWERIDSALFDALHSLLGRLGSEIPKFAARFVSALPDAFLFLTVVLITGFCFSVGSVDLGAFVKLLPEGAKSVCERLRARAVLALSSWFRAYLLIMGMTFLELFIGFSLLGVNYAFILAFITALVDILPVFGAGAVLLPWAAVSFILGDRSLGIRLFVLWVIISVIREFAEPRIVGKTLGISPVLTLFSMYAGFRLFGVIGMLLSPLILMLAKSFISE